MGDRSVIKEKKSYPSDTKYIFISSTWIYRLVGDETREMGMKISEPAFKKLMGEHDIHIMFADGKCYLFPAECATILEDGDITSIDEVLKIGENNDSHTS